MAWSGTRELGPAKTFALAGNVPDLSAFMALALEKKGMVLLFNADPHGLPPSRKRSGWV